MTYRILLIEPDQSVQTALQDMLATSNTVSLEVTSNGLAAKSFCESHLPDCILLSEDCGDMTGIAWYTLVSQSLNLQSTPVILMANNANTENVVWALKQGFSDYLHKSDCTTENLEKTILRTIDEKAAFISTEMHRYDTKHLADRDVLADCANRAYFETHLTQTLSNAKRHGRRFAILYIDVDHFKRINDTYGHQAGDALICHVASLLSSLVRTGDVVARLGGDEFAIILSDLQDHADAGRVATNIMESLKSPIEIENHKITTTASIGIACYPDAANTVEKLLSAADCAMYHAKQLGRGCFQFYTSELNKIHQRLVKIENALSEALLTQSFTLGYQPTFKVAHKSELYDNGIEDAHPDELWLKLQGVSINIQWENPTLKAIQSRELKRIACRMGIIRNLNQQVLKQALQQVANWQNECDFDFECVYDMHRGHFLSEHFLQDIDTLLEETHIRPNTLVFACPECVVMENMPNSGEVIHALAERGVRVILSEFGNASSSIPMLAQLPLSGIQVSSQLIQELSEAKPEFPKRVMQMMFLLAQSLNIDLVARDVNDAMTIEFLSSVAAGLSGHYFGQSLSDQAIRLFLQHSVKHCQNLHHYTK